MRFALVDNSTLTGVQRLLGDIPVKSTIVSDMDIACLETLVEALLFYDQVVVVDDYKEEWRSQRHARFPFLRFVSLPESISTAILRAAKSEVEDITPRVSAGQFTDKDFSEFFKLLRMNVIFTWDMQSSAFFLNQKMLAGVGGVDLEKYSQLADAIYFELTDRKEAGSPKLDQRRFELFASDGSRIDPNGTPNSDMKGLSSQASAFFAGLNWLAFRTIYFSLLATWLQADLLLHPIRHAFHVSWLSKTTTQDPSWFKPVIDAMSDKSKAALASITSASQPAVQVATLPLFSAWLVQRTGDPSAVLSAALDLRDDKRLTRARAAFIALDQLAEVAPNDYVKQANKILQNLDAALADIRANFHVATAQGSITSKIIKAVNFGLALKGWGLPSIPDDAVQLRKVESMSSRLQGKYVSPLYRSVVSDLASVARLGQVNEKLRSKVAYADHADAYLAKTEDVRFQGKASHWKRPM